MTPVMQSKLYTDDGIHNGNCLAACLASLLNIPLWMVPPFEEMFARGGWQVRINEWLQLIWDMQLTRTEDHQINILPEFYIANGLGKRGVFHSCIYKSGKLIHDPHPIGTGLLKVEWCWHLEVSEGKFHDDETTEFARR